MRYSIFRGGNKRNYVVNGDSMWDSALVPSDAHVEYSGQLKTRHRVPQFHWDGSHEHTRMYLNTKDITDFEINDELEVVLIAEGSYLQNTVFHNKKAAPGTKIKLIAEGIVGDSPTNLEALLEAIDTAKADYARKSALLAADPDNPTKKSDKNQALNELRRAETAYANAITTQIFEKEIDLAVPGYHLLDNSGLFQTNGRMVVKIIEGSLLDTCWTVSPDVTHHNDEHGCSCYNAPCETILPESPLCP